jgi:phosphatidylinositol glycan class B
MFASKKLFLLFSSVRVLMAFLSTSWYVPDETWQSVEISHGIVWPGKSFKTWEWQYGLRSYLHPLLFVPVFELLKLLNLDSPFWVALCPRMLQGLLSSIADVSSVVVFDRHFARRPSDTRWFIFVYATNWCLLYSGSRTLVNQLELVLTSFALACYDANEGKRSCYIAIIALSFVIRPTTAIFWLPLVLNHLYLIWKSGRNLIKEFILDLAPPAIATLAVCVALDSWFYGKLTFVPWNFLKFNLIMDVSSQYGINSSHWYLSNALPTIFLGPLGLAPLLIGFVRSWRTSRKRRPPRIFLFALIWSLLVYSSLSHKEHRFILPFVPLCIAYIVYFVADFFSNRKNFQKLFVFATLATHLPLTLYLSCIHQVRRLLRTYNSRLVFL